MTNAQYRTANEAMAELKVVAAQIDLIFTKFNGNSLATDDVLEQLFGASQSVNAAIHNLNEVVAEGGDIYNDVGR